jgi:predicted outer membrane protein
MEEVIKDLPAASQTRLRERFQQIRATAEPLFGQMRQVQDESARLLGVEPFDEAAFDGQQARINKMRADMTKQLSEVVKNAIKDLTPEERRRFADLLRRPKLAKKKGTPAVKRYGEMMIKDHSTADKELTAFAKKHGLKKVPADKPQTEVEKQGMQLQEQAMAGLKKLKGADFDREYLRIMVDGHDKELAKTDVYLASATNSDLKLMLEARKTTLTRHADAARELQRGNAQASAQPAPKTKK